MITVTDTTTSTTIFAAADNNDNNMFCFKIIILAFLQPSNIHDRIY